MSEARTATVAASSGVSPAHRVLLGVTGGIAAYKSVELARLLIRAGCDVHVVMTRAAREFVGAASFAAVTGNPVIVDDAPPVDGHYPHLDVARTVDVFVIAPATAATIARLATGLSEDVLTASYLACPAPVLVAPAMNVRMYEHAATQRQITQLAADGVELVGPDAGLLACGDVGAGRMVEPDVIAARILARLDHGGVLAGMRVVVSAGGTREPIDAVRDITNRSSGRMGIAIARAARTAGATVDLVVTDTVDSSLYADIAPAAVVTRAADLEGVMRDRSAGADVIVMAAAVSDYTVAGANSDAKLERGEEQTISLIPTVDIVQSLTTLREQSATASSQYIVAFAAETVTDGVERARAKRVRKGVDMIVHNDVSDHSIGFSSADNAVTIITGDQASDIVVERAPKSVIATAIIEAIAAQTRRSAHSMLR